MTSDIQSRYRARVATREADIEAVQALRYQAFKPAKPRQTERDIDDFDKVCRLYLIEDRHSEAVVGTFRALPLSSGTDIERSYSAQFYDLSGIRGFGAPILELGRFCIAPGHNDPEVLRVAWGAVTALVDRSGTALIIGCSSFEGTDFAPYAHAFGMLKERHLAPRRFLPRVKAPAVLQYVTDCQGSCDRAEALRTMPPLLRSYLSMGGWVSDHAVIDKEMNTLHVFTGLEVDRIPASRARVLRAVAG